MDESQEHVSVGVNEAHLPFAGHLDLVQVHLQDIASVLNLCGGRLSRHDVENSDDSRFHWVNECEDVA